MKFLLCREIKSLKDPYVSAVNTSDWPKKSFLLTCIRVLIHRSDAYQNECVGDVTSQTFIFFNVSRGMTHTKKHHALMATLSIFREFRCINVIFFV